MARRIICMLCFLSFIGISSVLAIEGSIGFLFKDKIKNNVPVRVYVKDLVNESAQSQITPEAFRKALEESFHKRRSIKFEVINNPAESDIQISAAIKSYKYMERGPMKPSPNLGATFADAAATASQNYAEMSVEYAVIDTKSGKTLWAREMNEYIKKKMTPEESIPLIYDAVTRAFVWKCFGKADFREPGTRR